MLRTLARTADGLQNTAISNNTDAITETLARTSRWSSKNTAINNTDATAEATTRAGNSRSFRRTTADGLKHSYFQYRCQQQKQSSCIITAEA
jgi:hypothetical protein